MTDQKFKLGDQVQLQSGGPAMTVAGYDVYGLEAEKKYRCRWFTPAPSYDLKEQTFTEAELRTV